MSLEKIPIIKQMNTNQQLQQRLHDQPNCELQTPATFDNVVQGGAPQL